MAGRSGDASLGLLEALELSRQKYEQSQKAPNALKSRGGSRSGHNFADLIAQGDQNAQSAAFGLTDFVGHEGKRLIDGKFGFDALSQSLPKLIDAGPDNLAQALATTRQGGAKWTYGDPLTESDRANLGKAGQGALDATWLAPAVGPLVRGAGKVAGGAGQVLDSLRAPKLFDVDGASVRAGQSRTYRVPTEHGDVEVWVGSGKYPDVEWGFGVSGEPPPAIDKPVSAARTAIKTVRDALEKDSRATRQPGYRFNGATSAHDKLYKRILSKELPDYVGQQPDKDKVDSITKALRVFEGVKYDTASKAAELADTHLGRIPRPLFDFVDKAADDFGAVDSAPFLLRRKIVPDIFQAHRPSASPSSRAPATLNMGFGFGGKDGERSLSQMLGDVLRGRKAEPDAPLLPGASAPTSLDDLFTGGPTAPRPDGRTMSPQQIAHLANNPVPDNFDFAAPTAFERMSAADEVMKQRPQPEALDMQAYPYGDGLTDFNFPLPNGEMANVSGRLADGRLRIDYMNVPDSMQRQGYGTKMHEAIMDWARKNGATAIDSDNVLSPGAVGLYESMKRRGFDITKNAEPRVTASGQVADGPIYSLGLGSTKKPLGYDDWSPEWKAAFDKGLPMDTASRMARAREQGFNVDEPLFHGTLSDFEAFDPSRSRAGDTPLGVHLGTDEQAGVAVSTSQFEKMKRNKDFTDGASILPVFSRTQNPIRFEDPTNWTKERVLSQMAWNDPPIELGKPSYDVTPGDIVDALKKAGHDSAVYKNLHEGAGDSKIVFDPANIRSTSAAFDPANIGKPTLLGMGAPFEGKGEQPLLGALSDALSGKKGIKAYHGSPHDFDRFDMSKIGTGEGEQAYGHGLYFAENENVAKWYRDSLTTTADRVKDTARRAVNLDNGDTAKAVRYLRGQAKALQQQNDAQEALVYSGAADLIEQGAWDNPGKMYEVNINAEPEKFIDWDKAFSEQHPIVADTLNKMGFAPTSDLEKELPVSMWLRGSLKPETADALRKSGVPGVKYLDQSSRAAGDGSRNYVVFDDKLVDINRKYMGAGDSDLIKLLMSYGAFGGMSAGALATLEAQKNAPALAGRGF